ncbi:MAG: ABC transporter substrate-binding protein [Micromonosporaceae bacterium]
MRPRPIRVAALAAAALAAASLAACGGSSKPSSSSSAGKPVSGGTLRFVSSGDFDHIDPLSGYTTTDVQISRAWSRQLVTNPASNNFQTAISVVPDIATVVPSMSNGGISADGKTYTFHLRSDAMWNSNPPRAVVAGDFVREFKRMCNPVLGVGNPGYYVPVIQGMSAYCDAYAKVPSTATAAQLANFQNTHNISGVSAPNATTLVINLVQPASDFLNILASLNFANAAPVEYDSFLPDSPQFRQHTLSDGPYAITGYTATKQVVLTKNPAWTQSSDPVRHQYVNKIVINEGQSSATAVQQQLQGGSADLSWDVAFPPAQIPAMQSSKDPNFGIFGGHISNPYLVFNMVAGPAAKSLALRQAIEYAINKVAIAKDYGGTQLNPPISTVIPPGNVGYQPYNLYPTPGNNGDPAKCKSILATTPYAKGVTLTMAYRNSGNHPAVFASVQAALAACGIKVAGKVFNSVAMYPFLEDPANNKADKWDIAEPGWVPDWYGNNGRTTVQPLFGTNCTNPTTNYGCYSSKTVDDLIAKALSATSTTDAGNFWHQADVQIMKDAAIVPFMNNNVPLYHSSRVKNVIYMPGAQQFDPTQLWLNPNTP